MEYESKLREILEEVRRGAFEDGFHAKSLLGYPKQSDRYIESALEAIAKLFIGADSKKVITIPIQDIIEVELINDHLGYVSKVVLHTTNGSKEFVNSKHECEKLFNFYRDLLNERTTGNTEESA